jgi:DNA primase
MPRIPDAQLEQLKQEVSVQRLVEGFGVELRKSGKDWAGKCPFHADDTASLIITPAKNLWHCFGCQVGGGVVDWVMKARGVSFRHAVQLLKEDAALVTLADASLAAETAGAAREPSPRPAPKKTTVPTLPAPVTLDADDRALLLQVVDYYQRCLKDAPEALAYLQSRGLTHPELIDHFKLGYANRTLGLRLPHKNRVEGAQMRSRLERLGVYRESGHEHLNGSLVIPVLDEQAQVRELYGRKIISNLRAGTPKHLYLPMSESRANSGGRGVFNIAAFKSSAEIILCESLIDTLTFWCAGFRNVTTAYGVEGFTVEILEAFKSHGTKRALIAFDRDEAGDRGADKVAAQLMSVGVECFRIEFPKGMDANEYALKVQPAAKSLGVLIRQALWMGKGVAPQKPNSEAVKQAAKEDVAAPVSLVAGDTLQAPPELAVQVNLQAKLATSPDKTCASSYQNNSKQDEKTQAVQAVIKPVQVGQPPAEALPAQSSHEALPAQRVPESAGVGEPACEVSAQEVTLHFGEGEQMRRWRIRGWAKNLAFEVMKVNVLAAVKTNEGEAFHVDTFDLYAARARGHFLAQAAAELNIAESLLKTDLGRVLLKLEQLQDEEVAKALQPKVAAAVELSADEHSAAIALLKSPDLPGRILADFCAAGVVGESTNKLVGYLAAVSRKLDRPLAIVIQSSSAAGKSSLMDAILSFVPEEERIQYSAMTGQSLFYMGQTNLKNKILAIAEEEGAHRASYALKLLQSEGELTIASTGSDPATGNLITQEYKVEGPMSLFMTTTAIDIDEELMNRCLVLSVDEERGQTRAIHQLQRQRRTLEGLQRKHEKQAILAIHRNAQRLLRPLAVVNPWADQLTFLDDRTRTRRDHEKYLTLIDTIALLHQHQRQIKTAVIAGDATEGASRTVEYIEASVSDIELANKIAHEVLGRSLDELPPQTRRVLQAVQTMVHERMTKQSLPQRDIRFSRSVVRAATGASDTQLKVHLARLAELEYLLIHRALRGQGFAYELLYDGDAAATHHLSGLLDTESLKKHNYDAQRSASDQERPGISRGAVGGVSGGGQAVQNAANPRQPSASDDLHAGHPRTRATPSRLRDASYLQDTAAALAA